MTDDPLLYLTESDVVSLCERIDVVDAVREALVLHARSKVTVPAEAYLPWRGRDGALARSLNMPGRLEGEREVVGTKVINACLSNPDHGLPRAAGLTMLFDPASARPAVVMDAGHISAMRTAAVAALGVDALAAGQPRQLGVVGAGRLSLAHLRLLLPRMPHLETVRICDVEPARAQAACDAARELTDADVAPAADPGDAVRGADVIVTLTNVTEGYIPLDWLAPGALLCHTSLDDALPEVVVGVDRLFVDDWELVRDDPRRIVGRLYRKGVIAGPGEVPSEPGGRAVDAEFGRVLAGEVPGRQSDDQRILLNPFGMSVEDLAVAGRVHEAALAAGIGTELPR